MKSLPDRQLCVSLISPASAGVFYLAGHTAVLTQDFPPNSDLPQHDDQDAGSTRTWLWLVACSIAIALSFGVLAEIAVSML